ncbi:MAG TPA: DUF167 domain-containing protein [Rhizobiales bacterium]|nr:DUF167 domain-containing protein [Hyphomicrobiales bacterium]
MRIRLTPNSSRDQIDGLVKMANGDCALKVRVRAVPEKGRANKSAIKLIAKSAGLAPSKFLLASGGKDRNKELLVTDEDDQIITVKRWLDTLEEIT